MKILVSIISYKEDKKNYLIDILKKYEDISNILNCQIDIILSTNYKYIFNYNGNIIHNITDYKDDIFWEYTWQNKSTIFSRYYDYDYIIESDDDVLITEKNILQYIKLENININYIPGFLITEFDSNNIQYIQSILYGSQIGEVNIINNISFFTPKNIHSACYIIDNKRMKNFLLNNNILIRIQILTHETLGVVTHLNKH